MAVDQTDTVDLISFDQEGNVVLTISDHLEWDEKNEHIFVLQKKINRYLDFIESGELVERYPASQGKPPVISVVALYHPTEAANFFVKNVTKVLNAAGVGFRFEQKHFNSP